MKTVQSPPRFGAMIVMLTHVLIVQAGPSTTQTSPAPAIATIAANNTTGNCQWPRISSGAGSCLLYNITKLSYSDATKSCLSVGMVLATITTRQQMNAISSRAIMYDKIWIGAQRIDARQGKWRWEDTGAEATELTSLWQPFQPDGLNWADCANIDGPSGTLYDEPCDKAFSFLCMEKGSNASKTSPAPAIATTTSATTTAPVTTIAPTTAHLTTTSTAEKPKACIAIVDLIFVLDSSGSIGTVNYKKQLQFTSDLASNFKIGVNDVLIGCIIFSNVAQKWFDLKDYPTYAALSRALLNAPYLNYATRTDEALQLISRAKMFASSSGGRSNANSIVIVITDGQSDKPDLTKAAAGLLKAQGITIIAVGIGQAQDVELLNIASGPKNVFKITSFDALKQIESAVSNRACAGR